MSSDDIKPIEEVKEPAEQIEPIEQNNIINEMKEEPVNKVEDKKEETVESKTAKQRVINPPTEKVVMKSAQEQIYDNYKILHQEYMDKRKEKADNLFKNIFVGNTRKKKR